MHKIKSDNKINGEGMRDFRGLIEKTKKLAQGLCNGNLPDNAPSQENGSTTGKNKWIV